MALLLAAVVMSACAAQQASPPKVAEQQLLPAPARVRATQCSANPSTLYGDEPVVFDIAAEPERAGPAGSVVAVTVVDQRERVVLRADLPVPGQVRVPDLPSGDFSLRIAESAVSCSVTVNRELSRGTSGAR